MFLIFMRDWRHVLNWFQWKRKHPDYNFLLWSRCVTSSNLTAIVLEWRFVPERCCKAWTVGYQSRLMCICSKAAHLILALYANNLDWFLWLPLKGDEYDCNVNEFCLEKIAIGFYWDAVEKQSVWWLRWGLGDMCGLYGSSIGSLILMNDKVALLRRAVCEQ